MKKIISVVGTRPNFIKLAAIHKVLIKEYEHIIIHTGQHYDYSMDQSFFKEFKLPKPNFNLGAGANSFAKQFSKMLIGCEKHLSKINPKLVIVYGDTNSTLAGALSAAKLKIPIAHFEAGARCYDNTVPEEQNRIIVDHLSELLFPHSSKLVENLRKEGIKKNVILMSDPMLEILKATKANNRILNGSKISKKDYYLLTVHREENTVDQQKFARILSAVNKLNTTVIFPVHPRSIKLLKNIKFKINNLKIIKPVKFDEMAALIQNSLGVITDSGGLQKEAYWLKTPCFTLRKSTEWQETVDSGWNVLIGSDTKNIANIVNRYKIPKVHQNFYSHGVPIKKLNKILRNYLS